MKKKLRKLKYIVPSIITLAILMITFYNLDLYPFSDNSIVQVDADYQFIPVLYRIYDFLHGSGNIIYDDIGGGNNIYISMIVQGSIFSPLTLLLYLTSRSNILNFYNIIIIIKMCLMSLTTYIYINKTFKVNEFYKIAFSVLYAFSGWVLLNYFNIMWLDSVILFPLIIMFLNDLLKKGKYIGYVITLSLSLMIGYYISYFILLFILFYSFIYIFLKIDKDKVKKTIFRLGMATLIAILISSFSLVPALYQTFVSSRMGWGYSSSLFANTINKSLYLMFSSVFLVIFTLLVFKYKKDKKNIYIYVILLLLFIIGLVIEPINFSIHVNGYWSFPYRYSFVTLFILMSGSLYYLERHEAKGTKSFQLIRFIIFILLCMVLYYLNDLNKDKIVSSFIILDFNEVDVYKYIVEIFVVLVIMTLLCFTFKSKILRYLSFSIVCLMQIFIYSGYTMYYSEGYYLTLYSNIVNNHLELVRDDIKRYKMGYTAYTPDYGFIYDVNTIDNWLHILPEGAIDSYEKLGYKNTDTCIRSYGGTIFSDWLLNFGYLIDNKDILRNENMYELVDTHYNYSLYKYRYNNKFGLVYNRVNDEVDYGYLSGFTLQNNVYRYLFNRDDDIISTEIYNYEAGTEDIVINYDINEKGYLYLYFYREIDYIKVNGNYIEYEKSGYIVDLGYYEDDVTIEIGTNEDYYSSFDIKLGFIKHDDIMNLDSNVSEVTELDYGYDVKVNNDMENGYLFLPINNISGLIAYVNGKSVEIESYMNNFVTIKLDEGINEVEIRYEIPLFKLGIVLSIIGIIILLLFNKIPNNKIILNITYYVYMFVCLFFYLYIYGYSIFKYYYK